VTQRTPGAAARSSSIAIRALPPPTARRRRCRATPRGDVEPFTAQETEEEDHGRSPAQLRAARRTSRRCSSAPCGSRGPARRPPQLIDETAAVLGVHDDASTRRRGPLRAAAGALARRTSWAVSTVGRRGRRCHRRAGRPATEVHDVAVRAAARRSRSMSGTAGRAWPPRPTPAVESSRSDSRPEPCVPWAKALVTSSTSAPSRANAAHNACRRAGESRRSTLDAHAETIRTCRRAHLLHRQHRAAHLLLRGSTRSPPRAALPFAPRSSSRQRLRDGSAESARAHPRR